MTKDEARITILEDSLIDSYNTIGFLHGCLTDDSYSYEYPENTVRKLNKIKELVDIPKYCYHSFYKNGCEGCKSSLEYKEKVYRAKVYRARQKLK